jgi:hypothetical protein
LFKDKVVVVVDEEEKRFGAISGKLFGAFASGSRGVKSRPAHMDLTRDDGFRLPLRLRVVLRNRVFYWSWIAFQVRRVVYFNMPSLQHPFQCLRYVARESAGQSDLLIATAGAKVYSYSASTGECLDVFPSANEPSVSDDLKSPPGKRRKLSSPEQKDERSESAEKDSKEDVKLTWSNIPLLIVAKSKYVIFLTAEDKCIRVYSLNDNGQFVKESVR